MSDETLLTEHLSVEQMHQDIDALLEGALERHPSLELQLIDEAKQAHQAFKLGFPSHKSIASIDNKINS